MKKELTIAIAPAIKSLEKGDNLTFLKKSGAKYSVISSTINRLQNDDYGCFSMKKVEEGVIVTRTA